MTDEADRRLLLDLARAAIEAHLSGASLQPSTLEGILARRGAAFVTLHAHGSLRGCIGHVEADEPLGQVVPRCAISAASEDPRFAPISTADLPALHIEVSLLTPFERIVGSADVHVGRHGLLVEHRGRRGLLLPQVATEWRWDADAFCAHTCEKAGLPRDAWTHGATLWRFEAEVFGTAP